MRSGSRNEAVYALVRAITDEAVRSVSWDFDGREGRR